MKIAVSGKGGAGKSTVAAAIAIALAKRGERVLALDADPDPNLAAALGFPAEARAAIVPVSRQIALIEERTGAKINEYGKIFKLNPDVSDVAGRFAVNFNGVDLLVLGAVQKGGGGCACPMNTFARALVTDLVLYKNETLIMDMEAGVEHLGRATSRGVDVFLVVVEPGLRAVECALGVTRMCGEIGVKKILYVGNKIKSVDDEAFIVSALGRPLAASLPYSAAVAETDRRGASVADAGDETFNNKIENFLREL